MTNSERPGVYSSYEVTSAISGSGSGAAVGVCASAAEGVKGTITTVTSYSQAQAKFGECDLTELVRLLLLNGAPIVMAVPASVGSEPSVSDYEEAFEALKTEEAVKIVVCGSRKGQVHAALRSSLINTAERCRYRIGVAEAGGNVLEAVAAAEALNCERMVMVTPTEEDEGAEGGTAAALAGLIASQSDPAVPLNGAELYGLTAITSSYTDAEITQLVTGGVTPLENISGSVCVVRGVTTRTKTGGAPDMTWRELTTTLIADDVITTVRDALRTQFSRSKNTEQTRGAIRTRVTVELESKLRREIITEYGGITAAPSDSDPTVCEVGFEFAVAHGLNQIYLTARITV